MKGISKTSKILLGLGLGYAILGGVTYFRANSYRQKINEIKPLAEITKELERFDTKPKDSTLSIIEAEDFIKGSQDKDKNGKIENLETEEIKKLVEAFKKEPNLNTQITANNLQSALEFVLIRQSINNPNNELKTLIPNQERIEEISYSDFYRYAFQEEKPLIKSVILQNNSDKLIAVFLDNSSNLVRIPHDLTTLNDLANKLASNGIEVQIKEAEKPGILGPLLISLVPVALLLLVMFYLASRNQNFMSQLTSLKSTKTKPEERLKVTFEDVAGIDEAKYELQEVIGFLKHPEKYISIGAKIPRGVLLVGPPGTGKTLLAKAVAGEAKVPFFSISGSDFVEMFVGVGAARVRDLFNTAKKNAPCVVFIDEIDAVGRQRGAGLGGGHDEREQTLNQLLVGMDGFEGRDGVVIIAATNRPDILDSALLRPGRFDRQVFVDRPDVRGREAILKVHSRNKPLATNVDLKIIAQMTPGFTGADLANLLNESALLAARENKNQITMDELEEAIDKVIAGPEKKSKIISPKDKKVTAYHEIGHAIVAFYEKNSDPLHKVTIIPRGMALGLTMTRPEEDHLNYSKSQLLSKIKLLLGGRAAEEIIFGKDEITTGAQNDLERATNLVRKMITKFGMSEELGPLTFGETNEQIFLGRDFGQVKNYSEKTASKIDDEMKKIITKLHEEVKNLLLSKRKHMDALAHVLLKEETLDREEFKKVIEEVDNNQFHFEEKAA